MSHIPNNSTNKPTHAPTPLFSDLNLTAADFADLKMQIARSLGQAQPNPNAHDEPANASGEFGSETNPVRCTSVHACIDYLKRLRTKDGLSIQFTRKGCVVNKIVSPHPIDMYELAGGVDSMVMKTIYLSCYQTCDSTIAPEGFALDK